MSIVEELLIKKAGLIGSLLKHNLKKNKLPMLLTGLNAYRNTGDKGKTLAHVGRSISLGGVKVHQVENVIKNNKFSKLHKKNNLEHLNNKIPVL